MKLPNGYGSVYKLSGSRRRPWVAKKFVGWGKNASGNPKPVYGVIGYFATQYEALQSLAEYNKNPVDLLRKDKTFSDVYAEWSDAKYPNISASMASDYKGAYKYCGLLHDQVFKDLTAYDYEEMVKQTEIPRTYIHRINVLLSQLYQYALKHDIVTKNVAELTYIPEDNETRNAHNLFTEKEVDYLFTLQGDVIVDIILVSLYTGMRPSEVVSLKPENVDVNARTITGGIKTKAGKNRVVPIHSKILPIVSKRAINGQIGLFMTEIGTIMSYKTYRLGFNSLITGHTPYDTRHTFASAWHLCGLDPLIEKLVMGHAVVDITKGVYTHLPVIRMIEEIDKLVIS